MRALQRRVSKIHAKWGLGYRCAAASPPSRMSFNMVCNHKASHQYNMHTSPMLNNHSSQHTNTIPAQSVQLWGWMLHQVPTVSC